MQMLLVVIAIHVQEVDYISDRENRTAERKEGEEMKIVADFTLPADNLCKQFGPRSGLTKCR